MRLIRWVVSLVILSLCPAPASADALFRSGLESGSVTAGAEFSDCFGTPTASSTSPRTQTFKLRISSLSSGTKMGCRQALGTSNVTTLHWYVSTYVNIATMPSAANTIFMTSSFSNNTFAGFAVLLNNAGTLTLADNTGTIGTGSTTLSTGTWYQLAVRIDGSPSAGSDVVTLQVNGVNEVTSSTRTLASGWGSVDFGGNLQSEAQTTGDWAFDDMRVNDATGANQNTYPVIGGKVVWLFATGNGTSPDAGSQGTDYETGPSTGLGYGAMVDESTAGDDATTYFELLTTSAADTGDPPALFVAIQDGSTVGIDSGDTILTVGCRIRNSSSTASGRRHMGLIKSGSSVVSGTEINVGSTTWQWDDNGFSGARTVAYVDPATGSAWTPVSGIDGAQMGVRATSDSTPAPRITMIVMEVEYTDGAPAGGTTKTLLLMGVGQ